MVVDAPRSETAGVAGSTLRCGAALAAGGHEVDYLFVDGVLRYWPRRLRRLATPFAICRAVIARRQDVDLVEVHEPISGVYAWLAASRAGARLGLPSCVVMAHGVTAHRWALSRAQARSEAPSDRLRPTWRRAPVFSLAVARLGLRRSAHVLVLNEGDRRYLVDTGLAADARVSTVANGVDRALFDVERRAAESFRLLFLGSWIERKGVEDLPPAWRLIGEACPGSRLTLAGVADDADKVRRAFGRPSGGPVDLLGHVRRDQLSDLLSDHDILLLPSRYEGMPLVALEAAAAGMAVVASDIPAHREIFRGPDPEAGGAILVRLGDPTELAQAVIRLYQDRLLLATLQARARDRARLFTWEAAARQRLEAYHRVLS